MSDVPYVGALTALHNSAVALTVHSIQYATDEKTNEVSIEHIEAVHFVGAELHHVHGQVENFIGFGESLIFEGGVFVDAYTSEEEPEPEPEEEEQFQN